MAELFEKKGDRFAVRLGKRERELLVELCQQSRALLETEDPSSDPAVARLFPAAYQDDPLRNLEYEANLGGAPRTGKLDALDTVLRTAHTRALSEEEFLSWMGVVNDLRLVLGTRIDVTEESTDKDFPAGGPQHDAFQVYQFLGWLLQEMLLALGEPDADGLHESVEGD
ncbi:MAG TPA: DUF2017 family protein [Methylomirabilota bacterium]|nr:DUF2017 family protein [Methylomirabilota bacterium]